MTEESPFPNNTAQEKNQGGILRFTPIFFWIALASILLRVTESLFGIDVLYVNLVPEGYGFQVALITVVMGLQAVFALREVFQVSKPGIDQTSEISAIAVLGVLQLMAFVVAVFSRMNNIAPWTYVFASSESFVFAVITLACALYSYRINVRSMQRSWVSGD